MIHNRRSVLRGLSAGALASFARLGFAQQSAAELKIALSYDPSSIDPHFAATAGNITLSSHMFDCLVHVDPSGRYVPGLATSWRAVDATTWEIQLRQGVKFHDGSDLTVEDVVFSLERPARVVNSPGPFTSYTKTIASMKVVDAKTLRLTTSEPYGPLPGDLSSIFIVSKKAAATATTDDFNSGKAAIGTGPFALTQYKRGESIALARNPRSWGEAVAWEKVSIRFIPTDAARVAALLSGDVDMIEGVPPADMARLKSEARFSVRQRTSWRTLFLHFNHSAAAGSPYFTDKSGKPLAANPLQDIRVRQALAMGIDRAGLVRTALDGFAEPAAQLVAPGIVGYDAQNKGDAYNAAAARKLLADAGYPEGFGLVLVCPNNRYINDEQVGQAVAQLWSRIGVQAKLSTMPMSAYVPKMKGGEFGVAMLGWGTMGADFGLRSLLGTPDATKGWGTWNWGKYSNGKLDEMVHASLGATDPSKRDALARDAMNVAMKDYAALPTHYQLASWAMRKGVTYGGRLDEFTFAHQVRPE